MSEDQAPYRYSNQDSTREYWMGVVDTRLEALQESIGVLKEIVKDLAEANKFEWRQFHKWQRTVDERLSQGSNNFVALDGEVKRNRGDIEELQAEVQRIRDKLDS